MIAYILHRLLLLIITLFMLTLVSFSLNYFIPHAPLAHLGWLEAYHHYLSSLLRGDFGISSVNGQAISTQLREVLPATLELCLLAFILALLIGIPLGITAGVLRGKWPDTLISTLALIGFSLPLFWLALLLMLFFSLYLGWLPVSGRSDLLYQVPPVTGSALLDAWLSDSPYRQEILLSAIRHIILPVTVLAVTPTTEVIRLLRMETDTELDKHYIKAASTRGLSMFTIIHRHLLHNVLPPVIPKLGMQFSTMFTLAIITEVVFSWPGLGRWLVNAIRLQDYAAISAGVMVVSTMVIMINVLSDIIAAISKPRKLKVWYVLR